MRETRTRPHLVRGLVALLGVALLGGAAMVAVNTPQLALQSVPLGMDTGEGSADVEMRFERADRLAPGAEVRYGGRLVGRVRSVGTDGTEAVIGVRLEGDSGVPAGVFAEIRLPTALGSPFIALTPPAAPATGALLEDTGVVPRVHTGVGPDLESSLASLGLLLNGSGIAQLGSVMEELTVALDGRGEEIGRIRERGDRALELYEANRDEIDRTILALDRVNASLAGRRELIDRGMRVSADLVSEAAASRETITALMDTTTALTVQVEQFTSATDGRLTPSLRTLTVLLEDMEGFGDEVAPTLDALQRFVTNFDVAIRGDHMMFDGALDLPGSLDALGTGGEARAGRPLPPGATGPPDAQPPVGGAERVKSIETCSGRLSLASFG
ncbi:MAG: MlaD family protein [Dietzia sp.]|uniref:MlaD family protein n=2 Tax=Dietzia TaxID=37914 RepID=UPI0015F83E75|nr:MULTISPECIES: MlaD family protein [unclassified Dietzia]MBB1041162.1 MCE family protein [Dietzia sp. Cai40]MBB1046151.1 MCE family protein [Dietzia sp. DQ11-44]MBB1050091.1 MCE family protein [Dietzia sp. CW19]MBC7296403.1 MCE family protein [Dietzia sp.]MDO8395721.1 MlaD family protein [Dietzia sp.]